MSRKDRNRVEKQVTVISDRYALTSEVPVIAQEETPKFKRYLSFDDFWSIAEFNFKLRPTMKEVIKKHFEARGFMESGDFDSGIKDFGI